MTEPAGYSNYFGMTEITRCLPIFILKYCGHDHFIIVLAPIAQTWTFRWTSPINVFESPRL
jgi:hypothetical protein